MALRKLGEQLTSEQNEFLRTNASDSMKQFEKVSTDSSLKSDAILATASSQLKGIIQWGKFSI